MNSFQRQSLYFAIVIVGLALLSAGCNGNFQESQQSTDHGETVQNETWDSPVTPSSGDDNADSAAAPPGDIPSNSLYAEPLTNARSRITLKPFGIKVSPQDSPVSPEKFTGYHSGTDFEATPQEANAEVPVFAVCSGQLLSKRNVAGYGGLATQSCEINGQAATVLYGHIKLSSVSAVVGSELKAGQQLGILGQGYSSETSNERKHLHLGVVRGLMSPEIRGYVQNQSDLANYIDAKTFIP